MSNTLQSENDFYESHSELFNRGIHSKKQKNNFTELPKLNVHNPKVRYAYEHEKYDMDQHHYNPNTQLYGDDSTACPTKETDMYFPNGVLYEMFDDEKSCHQKKVKLSYAPFDDNELYPQDDPLFKYKTDESEKIIEPHMNQNDELLDGEIEKALIDRAKNAVNKIYDSKKEKKIVRIEIIVIILLIVFFIWYYFNYYKKLHRNNYF